MKQYTSLRGENNLQMVMDWASWGLRESFQAILGFLWIGIGVCLVLYFHTYYKYYVEGVKNKNKSYYYTFKDLQKTLKQVLFATVSYLVMSYVVINFVNGYRDTLYKGGALSLFMFPWLYWYHSRDDKVWYFRN